MVSTSVCGWQRETLIDLKVNEQKFSSGHERKNTEGMSRCLDCEKRNPGVLKLPEREKRR